MSKPINEQDMKRDSLLDDFESFRKWMDDTYESVKTESSGKVATYIPELASVNPQLFAMSVMTVRAQRHSVGDADFLTSLQSVVKPFLFSMAMMQHGPEYLDRFIGHEPSGQRFNAFVLSEDQIPHNPMINAGAIMCCSLIDQKLEASSRFKRLQQTLRGAAGSDEVYFDNSVFLSEKAHAHRNMALSHYMMDVGAFPQGTDLSTTVDLYFQACSISATARSVSAMAATLANGGVCPITDRRVFTEEVTRDTLAVMLSCGMYDYSGRFIYEMCFPAKSGVTGLIMIVIPGVLGMAVFSPMLDKYGNSVKGICVCRELVRSFPAFHMINGLLHSTAQSSISDRVNEMDDDERSYLLISAASQGNTHRVLSLLPLVKDINRGDYDKRSALHLASAEGHFETVQALLEAGAIASVSDRWGSTPLFETKRLLENSSLEPRKRSSYQRIVELLEQTLAKSHGSELKRSASQNEIVKRQRTEKE